jgi:hypothetical protein
LVPLIDRVLVERLEPGEWGLVEAEGEVEPLRIVVATNIFNGYDIEPKPLNWVLLRVVLGDPERLEFLREEQITKLSGVGGEAVAGICCGSLFATNFLNFVAGIVATTGIAGGMAVWVASTSAIAAAASSSASVV